jgi:hypothetical protein
LTSKTPWRSLRSPRSQGRERAEEASTPDRLRSTHVRKGEGNDEGIRPNRWLYRKVTGSRPHHSEVSEKTHLAAQSHPRSAAEPRHAYRRGQIKLWPQTRQQGNEATTREGGGIRFAESRRCLANIGSKPKAIRFRDGAGGSSRGTSKAIIRHSSRMTDGKKRTSEGNKAHGRIGHHSLETVL